MTDDAKLIEDVRKFRFRRSDYNREEYHRLMGELHDQAADRLASLSQDVAEYRQSLNVLGEKYDEKCEQLTYFGELASQHADELNAKIASLTARNFYLEAEIARLTGEIKGIKQGLEK